MIIILFATALISFRLLWINSFQVDDEKPYITEGELDLREKDISGGSIPLAGEWDFYPDQLLSDSVSSASKNETNASYIAVPSDWSPILNPDRPNPYGYASYHVRILVDAEQHATFAVRVPSVSTAAALYA